MDDDVGVTEEVLGGQIDYYRRRAREYDRTAYGDPGLALGRITRLVSEMNPGGRVLEIACGTGLWTGALARVADSVTAIDSSPEVIALARARVGSEAVAFEVADVYAWTATHRFDAIFFAAWLSHVPMSRFEQFWRLLRSWLTPGGRVLFVDEHVDVRAKEAYVGTSDEVVERQLGDGTTYRIVKNFVDPGRLVGMLRPMGWHCQVRRDGSDWVLGEARPTRE